jgi:hypothetical protein
MAKATPKTATCPRCYATLRSPRSVARGYGDHCWREKRREDAAKVAGFKPTTVEKARELIEQGGIVPLRGRRIFAVVSSDGTRVYKTHAAACTCPAGVRGKHACYHRAAALLLAA